MSSPGFRRVAPAIGLFFTAPLVAEWLLGDIPIKLLGVLAILAPLYGGGALLIREVVRRTGRGWPSIFVLAFAYAVFEEAFTTQTLFNPNYLNLNLHLLQPAYIPALGIGMWWTVFVLTLHTVWSISVSIALVEALVPERATAPWLQGIGLTVTSILLTLAGIATTAHQIKTSHFIASTGQFCGAAVVCVVAIVAAFLLPIRTTSQRVRIRSESLADRIGGAPGRFHLPHSPGYFGMERRRDLRASGFADDCCDFKLIPSGEMERQTSVGAGGRRRLGLCLARFRSTSRCRRCRAQHSHRQRNLRSRTDRTSSCRRKAHGGAGKLDGPVRLLNQSLA